MENLLNAWQEFVKGKRKRADVQVFERHLMTNLFQLHERLINGSYKHGPYERFTVSDPKHRVIHKATVADRVLHRAIYRKLYPLFDNTFIADLYSCRNNKGTHRAMNRFTKFAQKVSINHRKTVWVLKCDIRKFFASVDHEILLSILSRRIQEILRRSAPQDDRMIMLLERIIRSFPDGLPLGNLTSQLFANVYMDPLDQFIKHILHERFYIRYADDFVLLSTNRYRLERSLFMIDRFLQEHLYLTLHPQKVEIRTIASGVDFLGWVYFPDHCVLRTTTKRRIARRLSLSTSKESIASYVGLLQHGNASKFAQSIQHLQKDA